MKIRTLEELLDKLDEEIAWREKEIIYLRTQIRRNDGTLVQQTLIRATTALLYAHWEGFIHSAGGLFISYVATRRLPFGQLSKNLVAFGYKRQAKQALDGKDNTEFPSVIANVIDGTERFTNNRNNQIDTKSNLNMRVFRSVANELGVDYSKFQPFEKIIDLNLVEARNEVAHGRYRVLSYDEYLDIETHVLTALKLFYNELLNIATTETYLRS